MIYKKSLLNFKKASKRIVLTDFSGGVDSFSNDSVLPLKFAKRSFNFKFSSGALEDGAGLCPLEDVLKNANCLVPAAAVRCYFFKKYDYENAKTDDRLMVYAADGAMYELKLNDVSPQFNLIDSLSFASPPNAVNYKYNDEDCIIFSAAGEGLKIYFGYGYPLEAANAPEITSMCIHYERLFATGENKTTLWFSDDFDPANWYISLDEAGFIDMPDERGALIKAVSFLDYLYVFRAHGISRVSAYGDQSEFSVTSLFVSSGKILPQSIAVCGDRILFLAQDGLFRFDGINTRRILEGYGEIFTNAKTARAEFLNGTYYLLADIEDGGKAERVLLTYEIAKNSAHISKLPIDDMTKIAADDLSTTVFISGGKLCALSDKAAVLNKPLKKIWQSPFTDFNENRQKIIRQISLWLFGEAQITIDNKSEKRTVNLNGRGDIVSFKTNLRGSVFSFIIESGRPRTVIA